MDWLDLSAVQGLWRVFSNTTLQKHQFLGTQLSLQSNSHIHTWQMEKPQLWLDGCLLAKLMSLLFNMLSRLVIVFLPSNKHLLISWLQSPSAVIFESTKIKSLIVPIFLPWSDGIQCHDLSFLNVELKANFFTLLFHFHQEALLFFTFYHKGGVICVSEVIDISPSKPEACASFSVAFCMMYSAYKLNKQGDSIQPWHTPFPIWNQSVVPCAVLTVAPWPAYRFLKRQFRWSGIPISFRNFHSFLWPTQSKPVA